MKKLLLALLLIGCSTIQNVKEYTTKTFYNKNFTAELVDSIISAEKISHLDSIYFKATDGYIKEYYYAKDSLVLRFIEKGDSIQVTKRINK